ncbi:MAG: radical SAM protein, partial [Treponema sp.]|nr:radical SAM protein [Treponema sp.]
MNILHISLMSSCNFDCYYCTVKKWLVPLEGAQAIGRNLLTNEALLKWFDAFIKPDKWYIELIGGEPGLYPEIGDLIPALTEKGYHGIVKTNGSLPIPESPNFIRAAAWYKDRDLPQYFDQLVIIKNPDDTWRDKESYCKKKKIKYQLV